MINQIGDEIAAHVEFGVRTKTGDTMAMAMATATIHEQKAAIRTRVRGIYDLQKLRIQTGNRIAQQFRDRLGVKAGEKPDEDAASIMEAVKESYKRITDGIVAGKQAARKPQSKRALPLPKNFKGDAVIRTYVEAQLVDSYMTLLATEETEFRRLQYVVDEFAIYRGFLGNVRGCGPAMSGVLIAELDPYKARTPSAFWKYAGLDVAPAQRKQGGKVVKWDPTDPRPYVDGESGDGPRMVGRSKWSDHLVDRKYTNRDGEEETRKSVTFNPWLKTKLFVLAEVFIKVGNPYTDIYRNYKNRLANHPRWQLTTPAHRNNAAKRYMIKMFLLDLWKFWREQEGLEVVASYTEAKLGMRPHGTDPSVIAAEMTR